MNYKEFVTGIKEGQQQIVSWGWSNNKWRQKMNRLSKKGYFKKQAASGNDYYTRTKKEWVEGDSINKTIEFSRNAK